jgi:hypothetical protein
MYTCVYDFTPARRRREDAYVGARGSERVVQIVGWAAGQAYILMDSAWVLGDNTPVVCVDMCVSTQFWRFFSVARYQGIYYFACGGFHSRFVLRRQR